MKDDGYSKNWKTSIRFRHRLAAWGFTLLKPSEPDESYYLYGKYQVPPENIPQKWIGSMNEEKERKLRLKAYQEASDQYKRDGYWKEKVRVSIADEIEIYKNICKYVASHPSDRSEKIRKKEHLFCFCFVTFIILFAIVAFSAILYKFISSAF